MGDDFEEDALNQVPSSSAAPPPSQQAKDIFAEVKRKEEALRKAKQQQKAVTGIDGLAQPKMKSFVDPQDTAERVLFDSQEYEQPVPERRVATTRRRGIRPTEVLESDEEDGDFQEDNRQIDVESRRRQKPPPRPRRQHNNDDKEALASQLNVPPSTQRTPRPKPSPITSPQIRRQQPAERTLQQGRRPSQRAQTGTPGSEEQDRTGYARVKDEARAYSATMLEAKVQRRKPWTIEESDALIQGIEKYGCSWANIKAWDNAMDEEDRVLRHRDQVALKDKARNMKVDYLRYAILFALACSCRFWVMTVINAKLTYDRAGVNLPRHFELVPLGKKEREKVRAVGRACPSPDP
jgi:hypothetical protein